MMKKALLASLFISLFHQAIACEIELYSKIIVNNHQNLSSNDLIKNSTCESEVDNKIFRIFSSGRGNVNVESILSQSLINTKNLNVKPSKITISGFEEIFENTFISNDEKKLIEFSIVSNAAAFSLKEGESFSISCPSCSNAGINNALINIHNPLEGTIKKVPATLTVGVKTAVLISHGHLPAFYKFDTKPIVKLTMAYVIEPSKYISNIDDIVYKQTVRPISSGAFIERNAVMFYPLVSSGESVKIISNFSNITIESTAVTMESGHYGQAIKLRNNKSNTIFSAKIVEKGLARIEL